MPAPFRPGIPCRREVVRRPGTAAPPRAGPHGAIGGRSCLRTPHPATKLFFRSTDSMAQRYYGDLCPPPPLSRAGAAAMLGIGRMAPWGGVLTPCASTVMVVPDGRDAAPLLETPGKGEADALRHDVLDPWLQKAQRLGADQRPH